MKNKFFSYLEKIKELNLPKGKWAILGSGPPCIRGIRDGHDIDLIVTEDLFEEYKNKENWKIVNVFNIDFLQNGNLEMWKEISYKDKKIAELIESSETIKGFPVVRLEDFVKIKKFQYNQSKREKDYQDILLAERFCYNPNI